jgi:hypothetical protein
MLSLTKRACRNLLPLIAMAILVSGMPVTQALGQDEPGSHLVDAITVENPKSDGRLELESVADFSSEGGTATIEPDSEQEESFTYEGIDTETNELIGLKRADAKDHEEESFVRAEAVETEPSPSPSPSETDPSPSPGETSASPSPTGAPSPNPSYVSISSADEPSPGPTSIPDNGSSQPAQPTPGPSPTETVTPSDQPSDADEPVNDSDASSTESSASTQSVALPDPMSVAAYILFDNPVVTGQPANDCFYWEFTAYNALMAPVTGRPSWTGVLVKTNANAAILGGNVDDLGRGIFYDCGSGGVDTLTVTMTSATATAVRESGAIDTPSACDVFNHCTYTPAAALVTPEAGTSQVGNTTLFQVQVWDHLGRPYDGTIMWGTRTGSANEGNGGSISANNGFAFFSYRGDNPGEDHITINFDPSTRFPSEIGAAVHTWAPVGADCDLLVDVCDGVSIPCADNDCVPQTVDDADCLLPISPLSDEYRDPPFDSTVLPRMAVGQSGERDMNGGTGNVAPGLKTHGSEDFPNGGFSYSRGSGTQKITISQGATTDPNCGSRGGDAGVHVTIDAESDDVYGLKARVRILNETDPDVWKFRARANITALRAGQKKFKGQGDECNAILVQEDQSWFELEVPPCKMIANTKFVRIQIRAHAFPKDARAGDWRVAGWGTVEVDWMRWTYNACGGPSCL